MHRNNGKPRNALTHTDASAGDYLIPERHFRTLEGMRDDLHLFATLASHADPERHADGLPMKTLASSAQRAVYLLIPHRRQRPLDARKPMKA